MIRRDDAILNVEYLPAFGLNDAAFDEVVKRELPVVFAFDDLEIPKSRQEQ